MGYTEKFTELDERSCKQLEYKAKSLVGHYGFTKSDIEDIKQELYLHLYQQLPKYDPARSSKATFVDRVLGNAVRDLIRRRKSECRDYSMCQTSLDQPAYPGNEGYETIGDTISEAQSASGISWNRQNNIDMINLQIEVKRIMSKLDEELQAICIGLSANMTPTEIAKELGICRQSFYVHKSKIRKVFEDAGMQVYATA